MKERANINEGESKDGRGESKDGWRERVEKDEGESKNEWKREYRWMKESMMKVKVKNDGKYKWNGKVRIKKETDGLI